IARWLRHFAEPHDYRYVTLGGTELKDISHLAWIDPKLASNIVSFESDAQNYKLACNTAKSLKEAGLSLEIVNNDVFSYQRASDTPHIFCMDLFGTCDLNYRDCFADWFVDEIIRPGDFLLVTSYLGRNKGWDKVLKQYD